MKELEQKYIDILEENDWYASLHTDDGRVELEKYSPAGEDFIMCVEVENFPKSVREYANDFDSDEHAEMWIEARGRVRGVPESIRELIDDAEAIKEMIYELADALEGNNKKTSNMWTLFVLDFDGTYNMEEPDSREMKPTVYLIPADRQRDVEHYARMAHDDFHSDENGCMTITDYFHEWMENNDCDYKVIGEIDLTFEERQVDYLADYIPGEIV